MQTSSIAKGGRGRLLLALFAVAAIIGTGVTHLVRGDISTAHSQPPEKATQKAQPKAPAKGKTSTAEQRIRQLLDNKIDIEFIDLPLEDVFSSLADLVDAPIVLNRTAFEDEGVSVDEPLTISVKQVSLRQALTLICARFEITHTIRNEVLEITTAAEADGTLQQQVIPVGEILAGGEDKRDSLGDLLEAVIDPDSWATVGGPGSLSFFSGSMVVSQTSERIYQVEQIVKAISRLKEDQITPIQLEDTKKLSAGLSRKAQIDVLELPLVEFAEELADDYDVNVIVDDRALEDVGIDPNDAIVSLNVKGISLQSALRLALANVAHDLTFDVEPNLLRITTKDAQSRKLRIYPVSDLCSDSDQLKQLSGTIIEAIAVDTWSEYGGSAVIATASYHQRSLYVLQTSVVHAQIEQLLNKLRTSRDAIGAHTPPTEMILRGYRLAVDPNEIENVANFIREELAPLWKEKDASLRVVADHVVIRHHRSAHRQVVELLSSIGIIMQPTTKGQGGVGANGGFF